MDRELSPEETEINMISEELEANITAYKRDLKHLPSVPLSDRLDQWEDVKTRIEALNVLRVGMRTELADLRAEGHLAYGHWNRVYRTHKDALELLQVDLEYVHTSINRELLLESKGPGGAAAAPITDKQLVSAAALLNTDASGHLDGAIQDLGEIQQINEHAANRLAEDREKLDMISSELDAMQNDMVIARRKLRIFLRRVATDKVIITLLILIVLCLVFIVVRALFSN
jgi:SNARE protein|eukprot:gnl/Ergobibamus_cyprinoides/201.p1 GENE.gnl/Ergobibamus_cyprinoides/201~~gnl/Ergobibamus_cyprinoides/201.p1  ORF type:complete len:229 (+),score=84.45 gnl/Ergobibamus_cyprinoides/201:85-771(+)